MKRKININGKLHVLSDTNISFINRNAAWEHFMAQGYTKEGMVLHHKDVDMKNNDYARYIQWNIEDLEPMTRAEHRRLHMKLQNPKGCTFKKSHKKAIKEGMKHAVRGKTIRIHREAVDEDTQYFDTMAQAAEYIGCSRQLVSQCLSKCQRNVRACGYEITVEDK